MPRTSLTDVTIGGMMAQQTSDLIVLAVIIQHTASSAIWRIVNNTEDVLIDGYQFTATGLTVTFPEESDNGFREAQVIIANANQWLTQSLRELSGEFTFTFIVAGATMLSANPPQFAAEITLLPMTLQDVSWDNTQASASLSYDGASEQAFPCDKFNPTNFPGIFS